MNNLPPKEQAKIFREEVRDALHIRYARWLTTKETARYLRCSVVRLETWRHDNLGPPFKKIGRSVIYARRDLDNWMLTQAGRK